MILCAFTKAAVVRVLLLEGQMKKRSEKWMRIYLKVTNRKNKYLLQICDLFCSLFFTPSTYKNENHIILCIRFL